MDLPEGVLDWKLLMDRDCFCVGLRPVFNPDMLPAGFKEAQEKYIFFHRDDQGSPIWKDTCVYAILNREYRQYPESRRTAEARRIYGNIYRHIPVCRNTAGISEKPLPKKPEDML